MNSLNKAARTAGGVYLALMLCAPFAMMYLPAKLFVRNNATATAANIVANETLFRVGILTGLLASVIFICLGLALYQLLNRVDARWATVMVVFVMVSATISFVNELNFIGALLLFRGKDVLGAIDPTQRNALGMFFLRLHGQGEIINEIFWGLWLLPLGVLFFRSGFLPRFIGVWLIIACLAWVSLSAIGLTAPGLYDTAFSWLQPAVFAEVAAAFWLVIRGAKPRIMGSSPKAQLAGLLSVWF